MRRLEELAAGSWGQRVTVTQTVITFTIKLWVPGPLELFPSDISTASASPPGGVNALHSAVFRKTQEGVAAHGKSAR
jgi:hypothetical protein